MKSEYKIKLNKLSILMALLSLLEPQYIATYVAPVNFLFRLAYYGSFAIMLYDYFRKPVKREQLPIFVCMLLYFICRVLSTGLYGGFFNSSSIKMFLNQLILFVWVIYISREIENCAEFIIKVILIWGEIIIYVNFITILFFPNGIWQSSATGNPCYFLGHKNQLFNYVFWPMVCSLIYHFKSENKSVLRMWALWLVVIISSLFSSSEGTFIISCFFLLPVIQITLKRYKIKFSFLWAVLLSIGLNAGIVFLGIQNSFAWLFDVTFTGRTSIWQNVLDMLPQRLFLGWGDWFSSFSGLYFLYGLQSTHNGLLDILMYGGLLGLSVWIITNIVTIIRVKRYKNNYMSSLFAIVFFAFYIHGIVEASYGGLTMYMLFAFAINIKYLINYVPETKKQKKSYRLRVLYKIK